MLSFIKDKNFELVKVIKENGMGMKISSDSKWVLTSLGSTQLEWENPRISNNDSFLWFI
jgi:glutamine cyclotransferase